MAAETAEQRDARLERLREAQQERLAAEIGTVRVSVQSKKRCSWTDCIVELLTLHHLQ